MGARLAAGPAGYGAGWLPAEELRVQGVPFVGWQPLVWQARVGSAAVVDTVLVSVDGPQPVTPPDGWPFKRGRLGGRAVDVPDVLVRAEG